ncbi:hypothetical protein SVA_0829 [Sulfurifustis variabilis]|uniref:DUF2959 family protein n=1 Tax=Sulfurifustis variabilis TaxID=1675686 RepID=A0A1B4V1P2_9GAMM|nr:DUF2959 family protein [Sulfurifustis variabilis]BAU47408.1 hypothetical protein SVA_0829 [Sulfurifustis variabilis]
MTLRSASYAGALWCAFLVFAGCATGPAERRERVVSSLAETQKEITDTRAQLERTMASLITLMNAPPDELRRSYEQYAGDVEAMRDHVGAMEAHGEAMRERSRRYLAGWRQAEIEDPELRNISTERREEVAARLQRVDVSLQEARAALGPLQRELEDIRSAVGNDLTSAGVSAVAGSEVARSAMDHGAAVARLMDRAIADFDQLVARLGPANR